MQVTKPTHAKELVNFNVNELSICYRRERQWIQDKHDNQNDLAWANVIDEDPSILHDVGKSPMSFDFDKLSFRTPISMILGSFRREEQELQDHAEKHHSPNREDKSKWRKVWHLYKRRTDKTSEIRNAIRFSFRILFDKLELIMGMKTSSKFSHG